MFFPFINKKKQGEVVLILDIGSGSVAGSFVKFNLDELPEILYSKRKPIKFQKELKGERFKNEMLKSLDIVLSDLNKTGLNFLPNHSKKIDEAYCSLSSPWFVSQTKTLKIKKEKEFQVTSAMLTLLLKKEEEDFENSNLSKINKESLSSVEVIERKIVDIKLNGYKSEKPFGKKVKEAEFSIFMSVSETEILDLIEKALLKHFHINKLFFHSFTLISFSAIRDMYNRVVDFLMLDITGEVTDISLIKDGNILKTMSFPIGKNTLLRFVSEELKTSPEEALSSIKLLYTKSVLLDKKENLRKSIHNQKMIWSKEFQKAVNSLGGEGIIPSTVFFTADEDLSNFYSEAIKSDEFTKSILADRQFIISFINPATLSSYVSFHNKYDRDAFLGIESVFFDKVFELDR